MPTAPADPPHAGGKLSPVDREALERAIEICCTRKGQADRLQIEQKLASEGWWEAATFAADICQTDALRLKLWQPPPCWISLKDVESILSKGDDGALGYFAAATLLKRLLAAGLSQFEPHPEAALTETKRERLTAPEAEAHALAEALQAALRAR